ncbi:restriction system-associated AAA family ATPase [Aquimarina sp. AU474]|uniref:restriction system-associated AAA family ATPase n=1 Tax=Aquimarina sp. AU474 TaxID=2108529 RepID=UPI000D69ADB1|nr:restriction system-associated AAA family ATPase [Aquimarina sp. AU474]
MKLLRLKINQEEGFRSLPKEFEIYFLRDFDYSLASDFNPYLLAGSNGSGKSNVLEALAEIFFHLDCIYLAYKPNYFYKSEKNPKGFDPKVSRIDAYDLEYFTFLDKDFGDFDRTKKVHVSIEKKAGERPIVKWVNEAEFRSPELEGLSQKEIKFLLPEYVVGYASGNNETLSLPFFKSRFLQFDEYVSGLATQEFVSPSPEASLVYLEESYSQAILLTNLLMWDSIEYPDKKKVLEPFMNYVGLTDVDSFRLVIRQDINMNITGYQDDDEDVKTKSTFESKVNLLRNLDLKDREDSVFIRSYIEKLKRCASSWYEQQNYDTYREEDDLEEYFDDSKHLVLDYKVNDATKQAFQFHFEHDPLKLFELFQLLLVQDLYKVSIKEKTNIYGSQNMFLNQDISLRPNELDRIIRFKDFHIKKEGLKETIFTKSLSDGEHQFLHSLGLCLLFKDTRSLFLMDEPETHFNPDWKAKFVTSLRNCFSKEEKSSEETMREMLITTHSPYLISDSRSEYVHVFKKDRETGKVIENLRPGFQTFGTSVNKIGIRIFEMPNTIGEYAQQRLNEFDKELKRLKSKKSLEKLIVKVKSEMGDSVERVLFVNKIMDKIEAIK